MSDFEINLNLLVDIIEKKRNNLEQILNITLNQHELIGKNDGYELFVEMNREKQHLIDDILALDNVFQRKFDLIAHNFNSKVVSEAYYKKISLIQDCIKIVLRLDNDIRVQEEKNTKELQEIKPPKYKDLNKVSGNKTNDLLKLYKSNNKENSF